MYTLTTRYEWTTKKFTIAYNRTPAIGRYSDGDV